MHDLIAATPQAFCLDCGTPPAHPAQEVWVRTAEGDLCLECAALLGLEVPLTPPNSRIRGPATPAV